MLTYTVHEPTPPPADRIDRAESLVFVKDGFSWAAALFAPIWLFLHRIWWPLLGYIVLIALFNLVLWSTAVPSDWVSLAMIGLHLLIGFEADTLRRWALDRRGARTLGSVSGRNADECERRFFDTWLPGQPLIAAPSSGTGAAPLSGAPPRSSPVIGSLLGARS